MSTATTRPPPGTQEETRAPGGEGRKICVSTGENAKSVKPVGRISLNPAKFEARSRELVLREVAAKSPTWTALRDLCDDVEDAPDEGKP